MSIANRKQIPLYNVHMPQEASLLVSDILASGHIASGRNVAKFENLLGEYLGTRWVTATGDASTSLSLCLSMLGIRPGDQVLASPMACLATNVPVLNLFASVGWCDVDPGTGNLCADDLRKRISAQTKAIIVFHWAGNPGDLDAIYRVAREHGLPVIEDASEALGAEYGRKKLGNTGADYTVFSFYANRHITTVEGAAIAFSRETDYERGRWLKRYGIHQPTFRDPDGELSLNSDIPIAGWNSSMNHVAATMGVAQMQYLPRIIAKHRENGDYFDKAFHEVPNLKVLRRPPSAASSYWVYTFLTSDRDELLKKLKERRIQASKVHLRNDSYSCFGPPAEDLPGVDCFQSQAISIPCGWWVSEEERTYIASSVIECKTSQSNRAA